ncbi:Leukocyte receptor cluster member 8 [Lemmus lemmus]
MKKQSGSQVHSLHPKVQMAANVGDQRGTDWSSQFIMVAGAGRENNMEIPMHKNPEWQKAHQALASISKAEAASSSKANGSGPAASALRQKPQLCRSSNSATDGSSNPTMPSLTATTAP